MSVEFPVFSFKFGGVAMKTLARTMSVLLAFFVWSSLALAATQEDAENALYYAGEDEAGCSLVQGIADDGEANCDNDSEEAWGRLDENTPPGDANVAAEISEGDEDWDAGIEEMDLGDYWYDEAMEALNEADTAYDDEDWDECVNQATIASFYFEDAGDYYGDADSDFDPALAHYAAAELMMDALEW